MRKQNKGVKKKEARILFSLTFGKNVTKAFVSS